MKEKILINGKEMTVLELVELYAETKNDLSVANQLIDAKQREIEELETELRVKEDLFKIQSGLKNGEFSETVEIDGEYRRLTHTESGAIKISNLPYKEKSRASIEWYEQRYQSDCITINQLHTTIDVLTDKLARLREVKGL